MKDHPDFQPTPSFKCPAVVQRPVYQPPHGDLIVQLTRVPLNTPSGVGNDWAKLTDKLTTPRSSDPAGLFTSHCTRRVLWATLVPNLRVCVWEKSDPTLSLSNSDTRLLLRACLIFLPSNVQVFLNWCFYHSTKPGIKVFNECALAFSSSLPFSSFPVLRSPADHCAFLGTVLSWHFLLHLESLWHPLCPHPQALSSAFPWH